MRIVRDDEHAVLGHREIGLERRDADRERALERRQRVLGRKAARAAVALQVEGRGGNAAASATKTRKPILMAET